VTIPALRPWRVAALALLATGVACSDDSSSSDDTAGEDADGDTGQDDDGVPPADLPGPPDPVLAQCPDFDMGEVAMFSQTGDTSASAGQRGASCGGRGAPEHVYQWTAPEPGLYEFIVDAEFDAVLYALRDGCDGTEVLCSDDSTSFEKQPHLYLNVVEAGETWAVVLDGQGSSNPAYGNYTLELRQFEYAACPTEDLGSAVPVTRTFMSGSAMVDQTSFCSGSYPEVVYAWSAPADGNYLIRSSSDQLIQSRLLVTDTVCGEGEILMCRSGGNVFQLSAGESLSLGLNLFGPMEGLVTFEILDYQCITTDLGNALPASAMGTIDPSEAALSSNCGGAGGEVVYTWTAPADGLFRFGTAGSTGDTVVHVRDGADCAGTLLACDDDVSNEDLTSSTVAMLSSGQTVSVVVDTRYIDDPLDYQLTITEEN